MLRFEASRLRTELDEVREEVKAAKARSAEAEEELEDLETRSVEEGADADGTRQG